MAVKHHLPEIFLDSAIQLQIIERRAQPHGEDKTNLLLLCWEDIYDHAPLFLLPLRSTRTFLALRHFQKATFSLQEHGWVLGGMSCGRGALTAHICRPHSPPELFQDEQKEGFGGCGFAQQPRLCCWMVLE